MMRLLDDWMMFVFLFKKTFLTSIFLVFFSSSMQIVRDRYIHTCFGFQSKELLRDSVPYLLFDACHVMILWRVYDRNDRMIPHDPRLKGPNVCQGVANLA